MRLDINYRKKICKKYKHMEEMVAANRGGHYEMDREILKKIEERRRAEEERAQQRLMKVQEQRETLRSGMGEFLSVSIQSLCVNSLINGT